MAENKHRWKIQLGAALASNPFLMNFLHGRISRTGLKAVCVPGLNCYSCPAAAASCPIGALQAVIGSSKFQFAWYVVGFLIFAGALLGRVVCGFLCPFGWFQELLHKIPAKKFSTRRVRILTYLKYGILALFVIVLPMTVVNEVGMGDPFFCKYICPAGILEGGIPLALADAGIRAGLGGLFTWKSCILLGTALLAVFFYRPFCKWLCPLGAFYGLCNRISICRLQVDSGRCTACGACSRACRMDVDVFRTPNHAECIRCGDCAAACPHGAITRVFSIKRIQEKKERVLILLLSAVLMTAALTGCSSGEEDALVSKTPFPEFSEVDIAGDEISSDIFADYDATIVNFWNNGCGSCIAEMPELEELYQDFKERNINLIGVGTDSGESREQLDTAREILKEKGVTYHNISPDPEGDFYKDFVADISTYPTTYIVDGEGNIVGADIVGNVKKQLDTVETRLALITGQK